MKMSRSLSAVQYRILIVCILAVLILVASRLLAEDDSTPSAEPSQLAKDMIGTWVLVGTPGNVSDPPPAGAMLKFITGKHWCVTQANAETGLVEHHHGGTYTLVGDEYAETVLYACQSTAQILKSVNKFKVKVEGDTLTQIGIGNPWSQVWKRAK